MAVTFYAGNIYRGLSSDTKPTSGVVEGSMFIEIDTQKIYIYYDGSWKELSAGGGSGITSGWELSSFF